MQLKTQLYNNWRYYKMGLTVLNLSFRWNIFQLVEHLKMQFLVIHLVECFNLEDLHQQLMVLFL